jgi:AcrR family transcriptional regulator
MSPGRTEVQIKVSSDPAWPVAKRAIYESALRLFWEKGFQSTSVRDVVQAAGLTKGAFYHYFQSKDDLLVLMHDRYMDATMPRLQAIVESDEPPKAKLSLVIGEIVQSIVVYRTEVSMFYDQWRVLNDVEFAAIKRRRDEMEQLLLKIVEEALNAGAIQSELPARLVTFAIVGAAYYTTYWWRPDHGLTEQELGLHFAELFTRSQQLSALYRAAEAASQR